MAATSSGKILVTGASGGVGRSLVRQLLERGYGVLGSALNQADLDNAKAEGLENADWFVADFSNAETGRAQVSQALNRSGGPLVAVVGCAGVNPCGPLETTPIEVFRRAMEINAVANLVIYQLCLPYLRESKGRFIFVSSMAGKIALPLLGFYTASKYALEGLADAMRLEAGQWGVSVSLVEPGAIATDMVHGFGALLDSRLAELDEQGRENYGDYFAQQKAFSAAADAIALTPDEVAATIVGALESKNPETRYPLGGAVDLLEKRRLSSDREIDAMLNQLLPGCRANA